MSFDATEGDIQDFFAGCSVTNVRIVEDKLERKPKGFGYAEFATLDGLKKALDFNNTQFQGRNIRVSVAEPRKSRSPFCKLQIHAQNLLEKDRPDAREFGDWTRKGPLPDIGGQRRVSDRSGPRGFDNVSEAGSDRGSRRPAYEQGDGKVRDFGNWDRKGPLTPTIPSNGLKNTDRPVSHDGPRERRNSPAWGEGRSQEGSRPPKREFVDRPVIDRAPTAPELDNQWRTKMRPDAPIVSTAAPTRSPALSSREISAPPSPAAAAPQAPTVRPKLNLAKRTLTEAEPAAAAAPPTDLKPSPFGAARPVDTAAKEKEVEEKRQIALREKKEADDKAREEKRIAEEKSREEKKIAREAEKAEKPSTSKEKLNGQDPEKENGVVSPTAGKNYEILRRAVDEETATADEDADAKGENGIIIDDKAVKPRNIVQDIPAGKADSGNLTNGVSSPQIGASGEPTADALEDDGWSTVSKSRNNRRNGNQAARAIAS